MFQHRVLIYILPRTQCAGAKSVIDTEKVEIIWDVSIQTDHVIEHRRPDIVVCEKDNKTARLVDLAVPEDTRVQRRITRKMILIGIWHGNSWGFGKWILICDILIVVGALDGTPKSLEKNLKRAGTTVSIELLQKAVIIWLRTGLTLFGLAVGCCLALCLCPMGTARVLTKVLDTGGCNAEGEC